MFKHAQIFNQHRQSSITVKQSLACSLMKTCLTLSGLLLLALTTLTPAYGETDTQAIKLEAIELIGRLQRLQQQLLFPAYTQVSIFLSLADNSAVDPQSLSLEIDKLKLSNHVYTQAEIRALRAGGIQRLYSGNITMGEHKLRVSLNQAQADGSVRTHDIEHPFSKDEKIHIIEIILGEDTQSNKPPIEIRSRH